MNTTIAVLLGCSALGLAACGSGGDESGGGSTSAADRQLDGAVAFARCMREHGVDIPDPTSGPNGMVKIGPGPGTRVEGGPDPSNPRFAAAEKACGKHLAAGGAPAGGKIPEEHRDAMVRYAQCMRERGIDLPDPGPNGDVQLAPGGGGAPNPQSPAFQKADAACNEHLADIAPEGDR